MNKIDPDQLWDPWRCSRTEYPNMEEEGPLNSILWSWSRLYPAAQWTRTRSWTKIRVLRAHWPPAGGRMMEAKLQDIKETHINSLLQSIIMRSEQTFYLEKPQKPSAVDFVKVSKFCTYITLFNILVEIIKFPDTKCFSSMEKLEKRLNEVLQIQKKEVFNWIVYP